MSTPDSDAPKRLAMVSSQGSLDWAYPPFILASAAAAMGWEVNIFFTFYGLPLLKHELDASVTPLGNPAMPLKMPFGPEGFQKINWPIPTALMAAPGFGGMATGLMKQLFSNKGVATVEDMREMCVEMGVTMTACMMTMEVFGFEKEDFIPAAEYAGAGAFLDFASTSDVSLFI